MSPDDDRRAADRRQAIETERLKNDRRTGERRQPTPDLDDAGLIAAYKQTGGAGPRARQLLAEIERRGLDR